MLTDSSISCKGSFRTYACNTPDRGSCIGYNTLLRPWTGIAYNTRILTCFTHAGLLRWAISVYPAFRCLNHYCCKIQAHALKESDPKTIFVLNLRSMQVTCPSPIKGYLQVQVSLWSLAVHSAPVAQFPGLQRGWHSCLVNPLPGTKSHFSLVGQSELVLQPASIHATWGLPWRPTGHSQMAVWNSTSHVAWVPQAVVRHGSTHSWDLHALSKGQSWSTWHSTKNILVN